MLVLSRRDGERVIIGDREIVITVVSINRKLIRLGFEADPAIEIHREEVYEARQRERERGDE